MKKFLLLVLACTMMIGLAGFSVAASAFDVNREFEMEFHAITPDNVAVEGVQFFLYMDGVALPGYVVSNEYGVAAVTAINQGAEFSVRFIAPEGFEVYGTVNRIDFVPVELVYSDMLGADGFYEGVIVKQIQFAAVPAIEEAAEVAEDEDDEDEEIAEDEEVAEEYEQEVVAVTLPAEIVTPVAPTSATTVVSDPVVFNNETVTAWPVSLFAFFKAW